MIALESLTSCFQGLLPAWLCTCSKDGVPNVAMLSHVDYVDAAHVALSFQFFNKSKRNIAENPQALVRLYDPDTLQIYALRLRYVRTETEGPTFESMRLRIEAIASHSGLKGIFKLLGADIYEVLSGRAGRARGGPGAGRAAPRRAPAAGVPFTMKALQEFSDRIQQAPHPRLPARRHPRDAREHLRLPPLDDPARLATARPPRADRQPRLPRRAASARRWASATASSAWWPRRASRSASRGCCGRCSTPTRWRKRAHERGLCPEERRIPLPGLANPETQLGIPLLARDELIGVLCIETDASYRFHEEDRAYLEVLGGYLAIAIQNALLRERSRGAARNRRRRAPGRSAARRPRAGAARPPPSRSRTTAATTASSSTASTWCAACRRASSGSCCTSTRPTAACEFTNRRLRLDKSLELPAFKDNLESRLILLRRLEERCPAIRIVPSGRGRFRLELGTAVALVERP